MSVEANFVSDLRNIVVFKKYYIGTFYKAFFFLDDPWMPVIAYCSLREKYKRLL